MLFTFALSALALSAGIAAKEMQRDAAVAAQLYDSGIMHEKIMAQKHAFWAEKRAAGAFDSTKYVELLPSPSTYLPCRNGTVVAYPGGANNTFRCSNMDLYHFVPHWDLGSTTGEGASTWGWTSPEGREFAVIAQADGAAFVEITKYGKMVYLGRLPHNSVPAIWREIRGWSKYIIIGSEALHHNIQIFDMSLLLDVDPRNPKVFSNVTEVTGQFTGLPSGRTHNVLVNEETNWAFSVGAQPRNSTCRSGLIFIDVSDPSKPTSPGCAAQDGYVHDAQCVVYRGPHTKYVGREICYGYNEDSLTIYDITDKKNTSVISITSYYGVNYTHQGWLLDKNWQTFLVMDDEYDEFEKKGYAADGRPVTYIWDISDLEHPKNTGHYKSSRVGIDHNQYVHDGFAYQSNYGLGISVLDVRSIPSDPTGQSVKEVGYFDIYPEDDNTPQGGEVEFSGTWSSYSYFKSGYIIVNTIERGVFVVKMQKPLPTGFAIGANGVVGGT